MPPFSPVWSKVVMAEWYGRFYAPFHKNLQVWAWWVFHGGDMCPLWPQAKSHLPSFLTNGLVNCDFLECLCLYILTIFAVENQFNTTKSTYCLFHRLRLWQWPNLGSQFNWALTSLKTATNHTSEIINRVWFISFISCDPFFHILIYSCSETHERR